jgi:Tfp pilus assembly protein PilO
MNDVTTADRNVTTEDELWRQYGHPLDIHRELRELRGEVVELRDAVDVLARQLVEIRAILEHIHAIQTSTEENTP